MGQRAGFWKAAFQRAWREAIAAAPWSSSVRLLSAIAAATGSGLMAWYSGSGFAWAGLWGLAAVAAIIIATLMFKLWWAVPADLAAEAEARGDALRERLESYEVAEPDETLECAVGYLLTGTWTHQFPGDLTLVGGALADLRRKAHLGKIAIWGQINNLSLSKAIEADFWEHHGVDMVAFFDPTTAPQTEKCRTATPTYRYHHLAVVRRQIEREWPKPATNQTSA